MKDKLGVFPVTSLTNLHFFHGLVREHNSQLGQIKFNKTHFLTFAHKAIVHLQLQCEWDAQQTVMLPLSWKSCPGTIGTLAGKAHIRQHVK